MSKKRILVVEDDETLRLVASEQMRQCSDVQVDTVADGAAAVQAYCKNDYRLVLMDLGLPVMDGFEAAREIRKVESQSGRHVPIVAVTAYDYQPAALAAGMDGCMRKPVQYHNLVRQWLPDCCRD